MFILSITNLIEQALSNPHVKNASGNVKDLDKLFTAENLEALDNSFDGIYAFIAFHPKIDENILKYIESGGLSAHTGSKVMALFCSEVQLSGPRRFNNSVFSDWIDINEDDFMVYEMVRSLFSADSYKIQFPGVLFIERFTKISDIVYVSAPVKQDVDELGQFFSKLFRLADKSLNEDLLTPFSDKLSVALVREKLEYHKTTQTTPQEIVIKVFQKIVKYKGDIVAIVGKFFK